MEAVRIEEKTTDLMWDYDEEGDVLYISVGQPRPAIGIDIGEGVVLRYDEAKHEVVGITVLSLRRRLLEGLKTE